MLFEEDSTPFSSSDESDLSSSSSSFLFFPSEFWPPPPRPLSRASIEALTWSGKGSLSLFLYRAVDTHGNEPKGMHIYHREEWLMRYNGDCCRHRLALVVGSRVLFFRLASRVK